MDFITYLDDRSKDYFPARKGGKTDHIFRETNYYDLYKMSRESLRYHNPKAEFFCITSKEGLNKDLEASDTHLLDWAEKGDYPYVEKTKIIQRFIRATDRPFMFLDADTLCQTNLSSLFKPAKGSDLDMGVTLVDSMKDANVSFINTGVLLFFPNYKSRAFVDTWVEETRSTLQDETAFNNMTIKDRQYPLQRDERDCIIDILGMSLGVLGPMWNRHPLFGDTKDAKILHFYSALENKIMMKDYYEKGFWKKTLDH